MTPWLKSWIPFLFGTPQRTVTTVMVLFFLALLLVPGLMVTVATLVWQLLLQLLQLVIVVAALVFIWKKGIVGGSPKKGKKK